jgi:hypothetical protein
MKNSFKILVRKPVEKRPFGRPRHRWEDIKFILEKLGVSRSEYSDYVLFG